MKHLFIILFIAFTSLEITAQNFVLPLWPEGKIPNYQSTGEKEKIDTTDAVRISYVQNPSLSVYLPSKRNITGEAVVICPGGGYGILVYDWEGIDIAKWLNANGIIAIVLKYRLPNAKSNIVSYQSPLLDVQQALKLSRKKAKDWGINASKIGIIGFSAGGHLASTLGTHFDADSRPDFMALIYPVITMDLKFTHLGSRNNLLGENPNNELIELFSNEKQVKTNTPPTFIVHSTDDRAVPVENSLLFYQALKDNQIPVEMHIYPYGGHGYSLAIGIGYLNSWPDRFIDWLKNLE